jgi:hypothetical protein
VGSQKTRKKSLTVFACRTCAATAVTAAGFVGTAAVTAAGMGENLRARTCPKTVTQRYFVHFFTVRFSFLND